MQNQAFRRIDKNKSYNKRTMELNNQYLLDHLRSIPDFPQKGINFRDVTTLFKDAKALEIMEEELYELYKDKGITKVVGLETRGYVMGAILAAASMPVSSWHANPANSPTRPLRSPTPKSMGQTASRYTWMPSTRTTWCCCTTTSSPREAPSRRHGTS